MGKVTDINQFRQEKPKQITVDSFGRLIEEKPKEVIQKDPDDIDIQIRIKPQPEPPKAA